MSGPFICAAIYAHAEDSKETVDVLCMHEQQSDSGM
jgi:hypothetical protein